MTLKSTYFLSFMKKGEFRWNIPKIANALKISEEDVKMYFKDGRRISFLLERRIAYEIIKGKLAPSEGAGYDLIDPSGKKWEVRSISKGGIYFCPSYMVGSGRKFNEPGFMRKLQEISGYIVSDIEAFPNIPFWILDVQIVIQWWKEGQLGKNTKISRKKALELMK